MGKRQKCEKRSLYSAHGRFNRLIWADLMRTLGDNEVTSVKIFGITISLVLCLLSIGNTHSQEVYKTVDAEGNVIFTDKPDKNSEKVDVEIKNIQQPIEIQQKKAKKSANKKRVEYTLELMSPTAGQRFGPAQRTLQIRVAITPELLPEHYIEFYLNGERVAGPSRSNSAFVPLGIKMRGQKTANVKVIDESGRVIASSSSATVHVIRPR